MGDLLSCKVERERRPYSSEAKLLGVGGATYIPHTLVPLKSLSLDSQRVKKLALKLHVHSVH